MTNVVDPYKMQSLLVRKTSCLTIMRSLLKIYLWDNNMLKHFEKIRKNNETVLLKGLKNL